MLNPYVLSCLHMSHVCICLFLIICIQSVLNIHDISFISCKIYDYVYQKWHKAGKQFLRLLWILQSHPICSFTQIFVLVDSILFEVCLFVYLDMLKMLARNGNIYAKSNVSV